MQRICIVTAFFKVSEFCVVVKFETEFTAEDAERAQRERSSLRNLRALFGGELFLDICTNISN